MKSYADPFTPKNFDSAGLPVLPHGGVHADFTTDYAHIVRELMAQGYIVVAPRSAADLVTGKGFYELIDYGGREVDDALAARDWQRRTTRVDKDRVGNSRARKRWRTDHPHEPLRPPRLLCLRLRRGSGLHLILRMGYLGQDYRDLYEADFHIGEDVESNMAE